MRHVIAWVILLALVLPVWLSAQPVGGGAPAVMPATVEKAFDDMAPQRSAERRAAAHKLVLGWLTEAKDDKERQDRCRAVLDRMTSPRLEPEARDAIRDVVISVLGDPAVAIDARTARVEKMLEEMAGVQSAAERRTAARDVLIGLVTTGGTTVRTDRVDLLAGLIGKYIDSKDPTTAIDACMIAARAQHALMIPVLIERIKSRQAMVRYWSAKGLADLQTTIYALAEGAMQQFSDRIKAVADQFAAEDSPLVMAEIARTLGASNPGKMTDPRRNRVMFDAFMAIFRHRLDRLGRGTVDHVAVDIAALNSLGQWEQVYRADRALRAEVLNQVAQVLFWAFKIYDRDQQKLSDQQKSDLVHLMLKSAEVIGSALAKEDLSAMGVAPEKRMDLLETLRKEMLADNLPLAGQKMLDWVGGPEPGLDHNFLLEKLGVSAPRALPPPPPAASQPASP